MSSKLNYAVLDTCVLQKTNAELTTAPKKNRKIVKRLALLELVLQRKLHLLLSSKLITEYHPHIGTEPRNQFIQAFLALLTTPGAATMNYAALTGSEQDRLFKTCRYPKHDVHAFRTAFGYSSTVYTEENPMLDSAKCVKKYFDVAICDPTV